MAKRFQWNLGGFGTFISNVLVFLTTNWGVAASAALAILAAALSKVQTFFLLPAVQVGIEVF